MKNSSSKSMQEMLESAHLSGGSAAYIEDLYETFLKTPEAVDPEWRRCFENLPSVNGVGQEVSHADIRAYFLEQGRSRRAMPAADTVHALERKEAGIAHLIHAYRSHGHLHAKLDPLNLAPQMKVDELRLEYYQLSQAQDGNTSFDVEGFAGQQRATLNELFEGLQKTYCGSIGLEYMHIASNEEKQWFQQRFETNYGKPSFSNEKKLTILKQLTAADGLEKYLGSKYVGQKRFALEGADSFIPLMEEIVQEAGAAAVQELVIGMAHRGRLNVLVNVLGKSPSDLFEEFEGKAMLKAGGESLSGDVKYHMGFSSDVKTPHGDLHLTLAFNPSHLEIIGPVVEGSVRARQQRRTEENHSQVLPVIVHGDAAFAGQGVVMETFNMSQTAGYTTRGTIHIVINNQVGFTTNPYNSRSTTYCTDVAKMVNAPVIHVNGDDPEAVVFAAKTAMDFRTRFKRDIVIDLVCYRRHGHNEADEPFGTQPLMYQAIKKHPVTRLIYGEQLVAEGVVDKASLDNLAADYRRALDAGECVVENIQDGVNPLIIDWSVYHGVDWRQEVETGVAHKRLQKLGQKLLTMPENFKLQPQIARVFEGRRKMIAGEQPLDWGMCENLAYASLVTEGVTVRLSGQDSCRGTFAHRHAVIHDQAHGASRCRLMGLEAEQKPFQVIDSVLSEEAVLAFEYGFATAEPEALVIWEAQFGDFANGAQVVIDQFISSGYQKWGRLCGLVMLLPHGYEGMGPEHTSARLERYLQLCAEHNMQVCVPTTPAQVFHMLRRQALRQFRHPLIVMTPKSLLRHKLATSSLEDLEQGKFHLIIPEIDDIKASGVKRVVMCSGKVYYELLQRRRELDKKDVVIIRIEQLYPFPTPELTVELKKYTAAKEVVWCQEESRNQGAWYNIQHHFRECLAQGQTLLYVGREASASPAVGSPGLHNAQQQQLVSDAIGDKS